MCVSLVLSLVLSISSHVLGFEERVELPSPLSVREAHAKFCLLCARSTVLSVARCDGHGDERGRRRLRCFVW